MTLGELDIVLDEGLKERSEQVDFEITKLATLTASMYNANGVLKNDKPFNFEYKDFLKRAGPKKVISEAERAQRLLAEGNACMDAVERHNRDRKRVNKRR